MQRFLVDDSVKVLGGARFDASRAVAPEWQPFGGYYMVLPSLEVVCRANRQARYPALGACFCAEWESLQKALVSHKLALLR